MGGPGAGLKVGMGAQGSEVGDVCVRGSSRKFRCEKLCLLPITMEFLGSFPFPSGGPQGWAVVFSFLSHTCCHLRLQSLTDPLGRVL